MKEMIEKKEFQLYNFGSDKLQINCADVIKIERLKTRHELERFLFE